VQAREVLTLTAAILGVVVVGNALRSVPAVAQGFAGRRGAAEERLGQQRRILRNMKMQQASFRT